MLRHARYRLQSSPRPRKHAAHSCHPFCGYVRRYGLGQVWEPWREIDNASTAELIAALAIPGTVLAVVLLTA